MTNALLVAAGFGIFVAITWLSFRIKQRLGGDPREDQTRLDPSDEVEILTRSKSPFI